MQNEFYLASCSDMLHKIKGRELDRVGIEVRIPENTVFSTWNFKRLWRFAREMTFSAPQRNRFLAKWQLSVCFLVIALILLVFHVWTAQKCPGSQVELSESIGISSSEEHSKNKKLILLYNSFFGQTLWMASIESFQKSSCDMTACEVTYDKSRIRNAEAIVFHLRDFLESQETPCYRNPAQHWIVFSAESSYNDVFYSHVRTVDINMLLGGIINRTMTLRVDSDILVGNAYIRKKSDHLRPLAGIMHPDAMRQSLHGQESPASVSGVVHNRNFAVGKTRLIAWFVSNCYTQSQREVYVNELAKHVEVNVYGARCPQFTSPNFRFHTCRKSLSSIYQDVCYKLLNSTYKFYLSFENSLCKDYITEKLWRILLLHVVPVVLGGGRYEDILPRKSFINAFEYSPLRLAEYLKEVGSNDELYNSYFDWKDHYEVATNKYLFNPCNLCEKLHEWKNNSRKTYNDFRKWLVEDASCFALSF